MNIDTGELYRDREAVEAARLRGERLVGLSAQAAARVGAAYDLVEARNRKERRKAAALERWTPTTKKRPARSKSRAQRAKKRRS